MDNTEVSIVKAIELEEAHITLRSDGLAFVTFKANIVLDVALQIRLLAAYIDLVGSKQTPFLFEADEGVTITKEARDNATTLEDEAPIIATAVVVQNVAYALIANFYMKFNKPKRPYKVFNNKQGAIEWLKLFL